MSDEQITWESMTPFFKKYVTHSQYMKFKPGVRTWYKPHRCPECDNSAKLRARVQELEEILDQISGFSRSLRVGGPDMMDLYGLSASLEAAVDMCNEALAQREKDND